VNSLKQQGEFDSWEPPRLSKRATYIVNMLFSVGIAMFIIWRVIPWLSSHVIVAVIP